MKDLFLKIKNLLSRILTNEAMSVKLYIGWGIVTLIIFGFFGFYPVTKIFMTNISLLEDVYQNNLQLQKKIDDLVVARDKINDVGSDVDILDNFLPNDFEPQNYIVELSLLAGESGFSLDRVSFSDVKNSKVPMALSLTGRGDVEDLVQKFEETGKLTEVQNLRYSINDKGSTINMNVVSFIMEK